MSGRGRPVLHDALFRLQPGQIQIQRNGPLAAIDGVVPIAFCAQLIRVQEACAIKTLSIGG